MIEKVQRRATKYNIIKVDIGEYKQRLIQLRLHPVMYIYDLADIMFFYKIS